MKDLHDLAAPYVLGVLTPEETASFEGHLDNCTACQAELVELGSGLEAIALAEAESPPVWLRQRVLDSVDREKPAPGAHVRRDSRARRRFLIPALAAGVVVVLGTIAVFRGDPLTRVLEASDAVEIELLITAAYPLPAPETARVVYSESERLAVVDFAGLRAPGAANTYQLWLIDDGGPMSAGLFEPDESGVALVRLEGDIAAGKVVGVTEEPEGGSPAPTGDVILVAELDI